MTNRGHFLPFGSAAAFFVAGLVVAGLEERTPIGAVTLALSIGLFLMLAWIGLLLIDIRDALSKEQPNNHNDIHDDPLQSPLVDSEKG